MKSREWSPKLQKPPEEQQEEINKYSAREIVAAI
jgi:hypothetical protein